MFRYIKKSLAKRGKKNPMFGVHMKGKDAPMFGKKHTKNTIKKMKQIKLGEKNPFWKGDEVGYCGIHSWVKRHLKKSKRCQRCKKVPPYDLANISQKYLRDIKDWEWLCRKCHMTKDGRLLTFIQINEERIKKGRLTFSCPICGKKRTVRKSRNTKTCSRSCGRIWRHKKYATNL